MPKGHHEIKAVKQTYQLLIQSKKYRKKTDVRTAMVERKNSYFTYTYTGCIKKTEPIFCV